MSRQLRLEYPGSLWHITTRGNEKRDIYRDDNDRRTFLELLGKSAKRFGWILAAYVLMSNHYHLLVQLTDETLSRGMQWLNGRYPQWFNERYSRVGHLFQGRFKGKLIEKETYFLEVLRYVVLNPVRAKMVERPEDHAWSSHNALIGTSEAPPWLAVDDALIAFGTDRDVARERYRQFVNAGIGVETKLWDKLVGNLYLGSDAWVDKIREKVELKPRGAEHPRRERVVGRPSMSRVVSAVAQCLSIDETWIREGRGGMPRMCAAWIGFHEGLLTNAEIAAGLRLRSSGHVSDLIQRCDQELVTNEVARTLIDTCISTLRSENREPKM